MNLFDIAPAAVSTPRPEPGKPTIRPARGPLRRVWTQLDGAAKYEREVRLGYIRLPVLQDQAASKCRGCAMAMRYGARLAGARTFWLCGAKGEDRSDHHDPAQRRCGCVVLEGTAGTDADPIDSAVPAGRTVCSRFACPQGKWSEDRDVMGAFRRIRRRVR